MRPTRLGLVFDDMETMQAINLPLDSKAHIKQQVTAKVSPSLGGFEAANQECDDLTKQIQTSETNIRILASQLEQEQAKFEDLCQALYKKQK
jgi:hypothetical protein